MSKRTIKVTLLVAASAAMIAVVGCKKTESSYERTKPTYQLNTVDAAKVETDPVLATRARLVQIRQGMAQGDLLQIDAEFVNGDVWSGDINYKFEWFDDQGMPVETPTTGWLPKHIQAQEHYSLDAVAPSPKCKDFRLKLQRSKSV
jgi:uncharacterized protein YcfL